LIGQLITGAERRLGQDGKKDFVSHPFFTGINWESIRDGKNYLAANGFIVNFSFLILFQLIV